VTPNHRSSLRLLALRSVAAIVGGLGLAWGVSGLVRGGATDDFRDVETHLLRFNGLSEATETRVLASAAARETRACDSHAQRALLLMEIPLPEAALRAGVVSDFDQRTHSLETRAKQALSCAPRDAFVWLVMFGLEVGHGILDQHAFDLLAMSYETAPHEAWIAVRRILLATPILRSAPEPLQDRILTEFQDLIRDGYFDMPARAYRNASGAVRQLMQARIDQLEPQRQKSFADELQGRRP